MNSKMRNKRGQTFGIAIMTAFVVFIIGMVAINFILPEVTNARVALSCSDASSISDGTKFLCLIIDTQVPYFIWLVFSISMGAILARMRFK